MRRFRVVVNGSEYEVAIEEIKGEPAPAGAAAPVSRPTASSAVPVPAARRPGPASGAASGGAAGGAVVAQMPGTIVDIKVVEGEKVSRGQTLLILEAMKMANEVVAPQDGTVIEIAVAPGASINSGDPLVILA